MGPDHRTAFAALIVATAAIAVPPLAHAGPPTPVEEYVYDVTVRRAYNFPNNDAVGYGYGICDKVTRGEGFAQVMGDVKSDVTPDDEFSANYLVSYAVAELCPEQIARLRNSAAGYQPPAGAESPTSGLQGGAPGT
jgi:hypothetical protein